MSQGGVVVGFLGGRTVIIKDKEDARRVYDEHYGSFNDQGLLELHGVEAVHLIDRRKLKVVDAEGRELGIHELAEYFTKFNPEFWVEYLVYSDLRKRGYVLKPISGEGATFALYERGANPDYEPSKYIVYVVREGVKMDFRDLEHISDLARRLRKEPILAIVDRQGDIAYYSVSTVSL